MDVIGFSDSEPVRSRRAQRRSVVGLVLAMLGVGVSCERSAAGRSDGQQVLRFTAIPDQDETLLRAKYAPMAAWLSDQLAVPVEYVHATRYRDVVDMFRNGDVQLAWFGGLTGVQARAVVPGARAIAQGAADPEFYSYFIASAASGLEPSDEFPVGIAGRSFTFGAPDSTSGRLMPEYFIREYTGKSPEELFGSVPNFADDHDATCELVEAGRFDVGVVNYTVYDRRVRDGKTDPAKCRVIWQTPRYADYNFTAHPVLDARFGAGFVDRLQATLLSMHDPGLLAALPRQRLIAACNADYRAIRRVAEQLGFVR